MVGHRIASPLKASPKGEGVHPSPSATLRAVMGGVELDLRDAAIEAPPATIETTIVMGGAEIKVPGDWEVKVETRVVEGGVQDKRKRRESLEDTSPDLVIAGKVVMGGLAISA